MAKREPGTRTLPVRAMTIVARLTDEEKANIDRLVAESGVTLSYAMREGTRIYLEELAAVARKRRNQVALDV